MARKSNEFWIEITREGYPSETVPIDSSGVLIGRSKQCDISFPRTQLAAQHARITIENGFCYLQSLKSQHPAQVNGHRTHYSCLNDGDTITLDEVTLIFHRAGGRAERQSSRETARQKRAFQEATRGIERKKSDQRPPLHPLALAGIVFVVLGAWFWAFGVGAVILGAVSLFEIRSHGKHRGTRLALALICAGLLIGGIDACERAGGSDLLFGSKTTARTCKTNLHQIGKALKNYAKDYSGQSPPLLEDLYPNYVTDASVLQCPGTEATHPGAGYLYIGHTLDRPPPEAVLVIDDKPRHHHGTSGFLLRANGTVEQLSAPTLKMEILHLKKRMSR